MEIFSRIALVVERSENLIWKDLGSEKAAGRCSFATWCQADGDHLEHWRAIAEARTTEGLLVVRVDVGRDVSPSDGHVWRPQVVLRFADEAGTLHPDDDDLFVALGEDYVRSMCHVLDGFGCEALAAAMYNAWDAMARLDSPEQVKHTRTISVGAVWGERSELAGVRNAGAAAPRMDKFLQVHLWQSTGCHDLPGAL